MVAGSLESIQDSMSQAWKRLESIQIENSGKETDLVASLRTESMKSIIESIKKSAKKVDNDRSCHIAV